MKSSIYRYHETQCGKAHKWAQAILPCGPAGEVNVAEHVLANQDHDVLFAEIKILALSQHYFTRHINISQHNAYICEIYLLFLLFVEKSLLQLTMNILFYVLRVDCVVCVNHTALYTLLILSFVLATPKRLDFIAYVTRENSTRHNGISINSIVITSVGNSGKLTSNDLLPTASQPFNGSYTEPKAVD